MAGHTAAVRAVAVSPDGRMLVSGGDDRTVRLWSIENGDELIPRRIVNIAGVTAIAWSSSGVIAWGTEDGAIQTRRPQ